MLKQCGTQGTFRKQMKLGSLLLITVMLVGVSGCNRGPTVSDQTPGLGQPQTQTQTNQRQQYTSVNTTNPALDATMNVNRLLNNTENALTKEQKDKIRPILQDLNNTPNQSREALQRSANAINAVFTDKQKSFLARTNNGTAGTTGTTRNTGTTGTTGIPETGRNGGTPVTPVTPGTNGVIGTPGIPEATGTAGTAGTAGTTGTPGIGRNGGTPATPLTTGTGGVVGTPRIPEATGTAGTPAAGKANGINGVNEATGIGATGGLTGGATQHNAQAIYRKVLDALK